MDTRIEWRMSRRWAVVSEEGDDAVIAFIHEGGDRPQDITILPGGANPSLLADLRGRRYGSLDAVAEAIGTHLEGACRII